ncbi:hypothetical protein JXA32_04915 [Candidatus Sumerlaeota bacterium]|nr:hypothetical protein [Candidatus Sumerlaeota bacterium]
MAENGRIHFFFWSVTKRENYLAGIALVILLGAFVLVFLLIAVPIYRVQIMQQKYEQISKGMSYSSVVKLMGASDNEEKGGFNNAYWDEERLEKNETEKITKCSRYAFPSGLIGVQFSVYFDENDKVVGKHRSD